jgi:hypothetical protein
MFAATGVPVYIPNLGGASGPRSSRREPKPKDRTASVFRLLNPLQLPSSRRFLARHRAKRNYVKNMQHCGLYKLPQELLDTICKRRHSSAFFTVAQTKEKSPSQRKCIGSMYGRVRVCEHVSLDFCQMKKLCQEKYWRSQPSICNRHKDNHEPNFYVHCNSPSSLHTLDPAWLTEIEVDQDWT